MTCVSFLLALMVPPSGRCCAETGWLIRARSEKSFDHKNMPSFPVLATDFEYLDCVLNYISSDQMINNTLYIMGVVPCCSRANWPDCFDPVE